jgi:selenide,water dikinase
MADVHALTDVTGVGMLGHLLEICRGSSLRADLEMLRVPMLAAAENFARQGIGPGAIERNLASFGADASFGATVADWQKNLLADAQTSGGLLAAVAPAAVEDVLACFHTAGFTHAAVCGTLTAGPARVHVNT